jgi:nitrite reductase/ring-hydroxylating ferredoxin subunit
MKASNVLEVDPRGCQDSVLLNDWHAVAASTDITPGALVPMTLLERDLVAWRDDKGQVHVWDDYCLHRGARLSKGYIQDDRVVCPYHGWNYDGSAQCVLMPAAPHETPMKKARAVTHHVTEKFGLVWVCIGTPAYDVAPFPEWDDASYRKVYCGPYTFKSGYRALENFVDATHFPFVHAGLNGIRDNPDPIPPFEVYETNEGLETSAIRVTQPFGDPRNIPVVADYRYKCLRPLVAYFRKHVMISDPALASQGGPDDHFSIFCGAACGGDRQHCADRLRDEFRADADRRPGAPSARGDFRAGRRDRRDAAPGAHAARSTSRVASPYRSDGPEIPQLDAQHGRHVWDRLTRMAVPRSTPLRWFSRNRGARFASSRVSPYCLR